MDPSPADIARHVLESARNAMRGRPGPVPSGSGGRERPGQAGSEFGKAWLGALGQAFREVYPPDADVTVFSHGTMPEGPGAAWRRNEYLFDVSVVQFAHRAGPVRTDVRVPYVLGGIWQVESEIAGDFSAVAEDLGKLVLGRARWSLLVTARPRRDGDLPAWTKAIADAAKPLGDSLFVAFVDSYAGSGLSGWSERPIDLTRMGRDPSRADDGWRLVQVARIGGTPRLDDL